MIKKIRQMTDIRRSIVMGRSGTLQLAAVEFWIGSRGELSIGGIGRSGKTLNVGFTIDAVATKLLLPKLQELGVTGTEDMVDCISCGYEWTCPCCGDLNKAYEHRLSFFCSSCGLLVKVNEPEHANG